VISLLRRWRERAAQAHRLRALGDCPACGHPWDEHSFGNDLDGMCGECAYEFEHNQADKGTGLQAHAPALA
jgi:NMD protein affecting ribosome stability and mRNA decay